MRPCTSPYTLHTPPGPVKTRPELPQRSTSTHRREVQHPGCVQRLQHRQRGYHLQHHDHVGQREQLHGGERGVAMSKPRKQLKWTGHVLRQVVA